MNEICENLPNQLKKEVSIEQRQKDQKQEAKYELWGIHEKNPNIK